MNEVIENLSKIGFGGMFGAATAQVASLFHVFVYANGDPVSEQSILLTGALIGASLGRLLDRMIFTPVADSRKRALLLREILALPVSRERKEDLRCQLMIEAIKKKEP